MNVTVTKHFQAFNSEQRANHSASHRLGFRQRDRIGESFWSASNVPGIAFRTRKEAMAAAHGAANDLPPLSDSGGVDGTRRHRTTTATVPYATGDTAQVASRAGCSRFDSGPESFGLMGTDLIEAQAHRDLALVAALRADALERGRA